MALTPVDQWRAIGPAYFDLCWNSTQRPHRKVILDALETLAPFDSVLEVGCNAGVNLRLINDRWPEVRLGGIDASAGALTYAGMRGVPAVKFIGDLRRLLPGFDARSYDVVLTSYCLAYVEPGEIAAVLEHMRRIARKGLVIAEPMRLDAGVTSERISAGIPEWRHDYVTPLEPYCVIEKSGEYPVIPPVERLNAVFVAGL